MQRTAGRRTDQCCPGRGRGQDGRDNPGAGHRVGRPRCPLETWPDHSGTAVRGDPALEGLHRHRTPSPLGGPGQNAGGSRARTGTPPGSRSLYGGLNQGRVDFGWLRRALVGLPLPRAADGRLVLAVDVSPWLRPDAVTCPDRSFCHTYGRGRNEHRMISGWPYRSWPHWRPAAPPGPPFWTRSGWSQAPMSRRVHRSDLRGRRTTHRRWPVAGRRPRDPGRLGLGIRRTSHRPSPGGLPVQILRRLRCDRVMRRPTPPRVYDPKGGRLPKRGGEFVFGDPSTRVRAGRDDHGRRPPRKPGTRLHPRLIRPVAWLGRDGPLPIIEGAVIRLAVEKLPSGGVSKPVWLWWSRTKRGAATGSELPGYAPHARVRRRRPRTIEQRKASFRSIPVIAVTMPTRW
ncbi:transposase [Kitasatospora sp. NPDC085895]|uniref:transposase n=1 Tax=Kitasatospora sp. NPDC085895 TaxID=3155057 RepID=UPI00344BCB4A